MKKGIQITAFLSIILAGIFGGSFRPISVQELYMDQYKYVAISEMQRSGIPASIKMAQGIMESMAGRSELAVQANNHFGIKCKGTWTGETYLYQDDDLDSSGQLIHSCFRMYPSAVDSYIDHTDFILGRSRYKELFNYSKFDYESWALGLKKCGYATDPLYAKKLLETIRKYILENLDKEADPIGWEAYQKEKSKISVLPTPKKIEESKVLSNNNKPEVKAATKSVNKLKKKKNRRKFASPRLSGSK